MLMKDRLKMYGTEQGAMAGHLCFGMNSHLVLPVVKLVARGKAYALEFLVV